MAIPPLFCPNKWKVMSISKVAVSHKKIIESDIRSWSVRNSSESAFYFVHACGTKSVSSENM